VEPRAPPGQAARHQHSKGAAEPGEGSGAPARARGRGARTGGGSGRPGARTGRAAEGMRGRQGSRSSSALGGPPPPQRHGLRKDLLPHPPQRAGPGGSRRPRSGARPPPVASAGRCPTRRRPRPATTPSIRRARGLGSWRGTWGCRRSRRATRGASSSSSSLFPKRDCPRSRPRHLGLTSLPHSRGLWRQWSPRHLRRRWCRWPSQRR